MDTYAIQYKYTPRAGRYLPPLMILIWHTLKFMILPHRFHDTATQQTLIFVFFVLVVIVVYILVSLHPKTK